MKNDNENININVNKSLYILLATQAFSLIGSRMTAIALGIWLFQKTGRTTDLLLIPFFNELPQLLFGHLMGTVVDRYDRKLSMIFADFGQAIGTLMLFISIGSGVFEVWHLYVVVFMQGLFGSVQEPAADASITLLTNKNNRTKVNSIKELTFPAAGVIAPIFAGVLYVAFGIVGVIVADLVTFVLAAFSIMTIKLPQPPVSEIGVMYKGSFIKESSSGMRFVTARKGLLLMVIYFALINFIINGPLELVIPYILETKGSELILSTMLAMMSVSTAGGAFLMSVLKLPSKKIGLIFVGMIVTGFGMMLFGVMRSTAGLGISLMLLMMPLPILNIVFKTILQEKTPADMQGRVFSVVYQFAYGVAPLSFLLVGPLTDNLIEPMLLSGRYHILNSIFGSTPGSGMGLVISSAGLIIASLSIVFMSFKRVRNIESDLPDYN